MLLQTPWSEYAPTVLYMLLTFYRFIQSRHVVWVNHFRMFHMEIYRRSSSPAYMPVPNHRISIRPNALTVVITKNYRTVIWRISITLVLVFKGFARCEAKNTIWNEYILYKTKKNSISTGEPESSFRLSSIYYSTLLDMRYGNWLFSFGPHGSRCHKVLYTRSLSENISWECSNQWLNNS